MLNWLKPLIKYGLSALLISLLMQCSEGEELIPESTCKPETCEFKTEKV